MILLLGPTGAGKSVQAKALSDRYRQFVWLALGDLLRSAHDNAVDNEMKGGELVDDDVIDRLLRQKLTELTPNQVPLIDGHPRRMSQITHLEKTCEITGRGIDKLLNLVVSRKTAEIRLQKRARFDDTPEAIATKWKWFESDTKPVIEWYRKAGLVVDIDAEQASVDVTQEIEKALGL